MGHEAFVYGMIVGAAYRVGGGQYRMLQERNAEAIMKLPEPEGDEWPWLNRSVFALPGPWPQGTYRRQVIHFGLSVKDDPFDRRCWDVWFAKFERILRQLYWLSARVCLETDFEPRREFVYIPTQESIKAMHTDEPIPILNWERKIRIVDGTYSAI